MDSEGLFPEDERIIEDQEGAAARMLFEQAYSHTVPIVFFQPVSPDTGPPDVAGGSGVLVEFDGASYVITCEHVVKGFRTLRKSTPGLQFLIGGLNVNVDERLKDADEALDLAIIDASNLAVDRLGARSEKPLQPLRPTRWPPDPVARRGGLVTVCGFPGGDSRLFDTSSRTVTSGNYRFIARVDDVGPDHFTVPFDRSTWISDHDEPAPAHIRALNLGGLSGCPVFTTRTPGKLLLLELLGIALSTIPFVGDGVFVRSANRISTAGLIVRDPRLTR